MLYPPDLKTVARKLVRDLGWEHDPHISAVFIIGSAASGDIDALSDVDVVAVAQSIPAEAVRLSAYQRVGCKKAMIGFFRGDSPALPSNVAAVDKLWFDQLQVDISFCTKEQVRVYNFQDFKLLKPSAQVAPIQRPALLLKYSPADLEDRIRYDLRILTVHRERYDRWCKRRRWLCVDLSTFLLAARDIVLVLNGYWRYNPANPAFWKVLESAKVTVPCLSKTLEDIKELDDRVRLRKKGALLDRLIADLRRLCSSRGISPRLYDIEDGS